MSSQAYEILCPTCRTALPADAAGCPGCTSRKAAAVAPRPAAVPARNGANGSNGSGSPSEEIALLPMKEYHRLLRANLGVEGTRGTGLANPLVPAALVVLLAVVVGAAVLYGWL